MSGACGDDGDQPAARSGPVANTGTDIEVIGTDQVRFEPDTLTVPAGEQVTLTFSSEGGVEHDFVVEEAADGKGSEGDLRVAEADPGETTVATFRIDEPGSYTAYCSIPGHRASGMVAALDVVEGI